MATDDAPGPVVRAIARVTGVVGMLVAALLAGCTPPWYRFYTVEVEGRLLTNGQCEAEIRGDVARRFALPVTASYLEIENLPEPLPPTKLIITCGALGPAAEASRWQFFISVRDAARGAEPGVYEVVGTDAPAAVRAHAGVGVFLAVLAPDSADQFRLRRYRATEGTLTLTSVERDSAVDHVRVAGHFRVRARRYMPALGE